MKRFELNLAAKTTILLSAVIALGTGLIFNYLWLAQAILWFGLCLLIIRKKDIFTFRKGFNLFVVLMILYPILESIFKILLYTNNDISWVVLNSLEHFSWAFAFTVLVYFLIRKNVIAISPFILFLGIVSIVNLVGITNELIEYLFRLLSKLNNPDYYSDTMRDFVFNIIGSILSARTVSIATRRIDKLHR